jgi:hypothetical protein
MKRVIEVTALIASAIWVLPVAATTWRVERDGSGDFTVIQDAIDAASDGDTIAIGPGTYLEYAFGWNNGGWDVYSCAFVTKDNLTIQGAGRDQTIIGPPALDPSLDINGIGMNANRALTVRDLTLQYLSDGIFFSSSDLHVVNCRTLGCRYGIFSAGDNSNIIEDCEFRDSVRTGVLMSWWTDGVRIVRCDFFGGSAGITLQGASDAQVIDCLLQGQSTAIGVDMDCCVQVLRCRIVDYAYLGLKAHFGVSMDLVDNEIGAGQYGIIVDGASRFAGHGNVISGCSVRTLWVMTTTEVEFHGNQILPGVGSDIEARAMQVSCPEPCHYDFTSNYWGTLSAEEIADRIIDYTDYGGSDYEHWAIIDFAPFEGEPVATEPTSWGAVKALFH